MKNIFTALLVFSIAGFCVMPALTLPPSLPTRPDESLASDEDLSGESDSKLREMWDVLMSKMKNVPFKVVNVPAEQMVVKSICGPVSCLYDIVGYYNLTLPMHVPEISNNATYATDWTNSQNDSTPLASDASTSVKSPSNLTTGY